MNPTAAVPIPHSDWTVAKAANHIWSDTRLELRATIHYVRVQHRRQMTYANAALGIEGGSQPGAVGCSRTQRGVGPWPRRRGNPTSCSSSGTTSGGARLAVMEA